MRVKLAQLGRSQEWLARSIGTHPSLLSRYLNGLRQPSRDFEVKLLAHLDRHLLAEEAAADARRRALAS